MAPSRLENGRWSTEAIKRLTRSIATDLKGISSEVRVLLIGQFLMNASNFTAFPLMAVY